MITIQKDIPLAPLTTFEIGGNARLYCEVRSEADIQEAIRYAHTEEVPFFVLAGGSNMLIDDDGFDGLVIRMLSDTYTFEGNILIASAGCNLSFLIDTAAKHILGTWEKLAGIPGTLGGAVRGNAGAFGTEIKDVVVEVSAMHIHTFEKKVFTTQECDFSYRNSFFKSHPEWIIISATMQLAEKNQKEILDEIEHTVHEREIRHLQNVRAAGSYFMNPVAPEQVVKYFQTEKATTAREGRVPAGWLIDKVGMKGERQGGAVASVQHPNYLVNETGSATAREVTELAERIKHAVHKEYGITLQEEVTLL
jgi:UDP-N-acetylmuramate dehydrogenase